MVRAKTWLLIAALLPALVCTYALAQPGAEEPAAPAREAAGARVGPGRGPGPEGAPMEPMREGGERGMRLTPEQRHKLINFLKQHDPRVLERLEKLQRERPGDYGRRLLTEWKHVAQLVELQRKDPELFKALVKHRDLTRESHELAASMRAAKTDEERDVIRKDLAKNLNEIYDLQHGLWEEKIAALEKRLSELRDMLKKRVQHRDEIVERRILELTGEDDYLNWEFPRWAERDIPPLPEDLAGPDLPIAPAEKRGAE